MNWLINIYNFDRSIVKKNYQHSLSNPTDTHTQIQSQSECSRFHRETCLLPTLARHEWKSVRVWKPRGWMENGGRRRFHRRSARCVCVWWLDVNHWKSALCSRAQTAGPPPRIGFIDNGNPPSERVTSRRIA